MKNICFLVCILFVFRAGAQIPDKNVYLAELRTELSAKWPANRTINLVFHGHSVPSGYFKTPEVRTLFAYPQLVLRLLENRYPYAVINSIVTAIGGENSEQGAKRFVDEALNHRPDVLFIDYALNDRGIGLERALKSWEYMIETALSKGIKVILCTPTPDQSVDILDDSSPLALHSTQIRKLAEKYSVGLADFYLAFQERVRRGDAIGTYMSQVNHPNTIGHVVAAMEIAGWFVIDSE
ncbi:MAG: SGNH/GDSL hydrolase family protein [Prevotellaceae bacterium]|jgi:hypothetical protein|nr:SGNH/GDSL hydrolase family protein [Prevotellaceae bacterium]